MRQHARGRQKQRVGGGRGGAAGFSYQKGCPSRETATASAMHSAGVSSSPVLRERGSAVGFLSLRRRTFGVQGRGKEMGALSWGGGEGRTHLLPAFVV